MLVQYLLIKVLIKSCFFWIVNWHEMKFSLVWRGKFLQLIVDKKERVLPAGLGAAFSVVYMTCEVVVFSIFRS